MINRTAIQQWIEYAPGISFKASEAYPLIYKTFIDRMEGKRDGPKTLSVPLLRGTFCLFRSITRGIAVQFS